MIRVWWWLYVLNSASQLQVYRRFAEGQISAKDIDRFLLDAVSQEHRDELGQWPLHQERGARPVRRSGRASFPLVLDALASLAQRYLTWHSGAIEFSPEHFLEWRERVGHRLDPDLLVMTASALDVWTCVDIPEPRIVDARALNQITASPLVPPVALPELELLKAEGLTEVHRHLTLARLPSLIWYDAICMLAAEPKNVKPPAPYVNWEHLFRHARRLRYEILFYLLPPSSMNVGYREGTHGALLPGTAIQPSQPWLLLNRDNDLAGQLMGARKGSVSQERAFLFHAIGALRTSQASLELSWLLHAYLLLRQATVSAILQPPTNRKGLDRFVHGYVDSKWSSVGKESRLQKGVQQAFRTGGVKWLEGKVSTDESIEDLIGELLPRRENQSLIRDLLDPSYKDAHQLLHSSDRDERPAVRFTFHFLKQPDEPRGSRTLPRVAFTSLREEAYRQALSLLEQATDPRYAPLIVGIDVASLETHCPIEVFAPLIRAIRSPWHIPPPILYGQKRARERSFGLSVHAGEEFRHLAEGIRRVVETIEFCAYKGGDRLGHALALGIEPKSWAERWQGFAIVPKQVRLDDVLWMWRNLDQLPQHAAVRTRLLNEARQIHNEIFEESLPDGHVLEAAWRLRGEDPLSHVEHTHAQLAPLSKLRKMMKTSLERALRSAPTEARALWWRTITDPEVQRRGEEILDVELVEDELHALRDLQDLVLRRLVSQRLVIEANPSSNLAIGPISKVADHPIFRWAPPEGGDDALRPVVVVGSDDPAIFGSELIHEFALLALAAEQQGYSPRAIGRWLQELNQHARAFRFDGGMGPPRN